MVQARFAIVTHALTTFPTRRDMIRGIAGTGLGLATLQQLGVAEAGKKNKRKKKKGKKKARPLIFNQYGCVDIGQACRGDNSLCCSGMCEGAAPRKGKPDRSRCVHHNAGNCTLDTNTCEVGADVPCGPGKLRTACTVTTGNAAFCADITAGTTVHCRVCGRDTDCQGEFGPSAACVVLDGMCTPLCLATGRTACMPAAV
jgi:hypothetical protein